MSRQNLIPPELQTSPFVAHAVIAAWINGCRASDIPFLRPEHFPDARDQAIWGAILELEAQGVAGDYTALLEHLKRTRSLDHTDWPPYCAAILDAGQLSPSRNLETHARTVYENYRRLQSYREHMHKASRALNLTLPLPDEQLAAPQAARCWSVAEILKAEIAGPRGPWPGVIPLGLTVIGARPKYGKSLLMLQVGAAIGTGGRLFDQPVEQAPVLYFALEDSLKRLKQRLSRLEVPSTARIDFAREIKPLHLDGLADVEAATRDYGLIVVDTISRAVPGQDFNREAALYGDVLGRMQTMALDHEMSIVAVVHTRKPNGMDHDPVDDVLGSTQMTAAADCVLAIYREGTQSQLKGRARDMEDIDLTMEFDPLTVCWQLVGQTEQVRRTESEMEILEALRELGRARASTIAEAIGAQRSNTSARLQRLCERGLVRTEVVDRVSYYSICQDEPRA